LGGGRKVFPVHMVATELGLCRKSSSLELQSSIGDPGIFLSGKSNAPVG
jgi:hypothetical protein